MSILNSLQAYGIRTHDVVLNYVADSKLHFIDDNELSPEALADQYIDPDGNSQTAETTLARARMILATELGKDPLLRQEVRALFKNQALVSCVPTERGIVKINEFSPWFVRALLRSHIPSPDSGPPQNFKYLHQKPISKVVEGPQFLQILAAEADHCLTVTIALSPDAKSSFERRLVNAFTSDGYGNTANDWNEERARVVREAIEQHLLPMGAKYARDWLREETEDQIALNCGEILRKVSMG
jgi:transcription elongation factor SPT6